MRIAILLTSFGILLSGCATDRQIYVNNHPELSPDAKKIILAGKIKFGDKVAGMTKEQVRAAMGSDPDQFDTENGEDAWIWLNAKVSRRSEPNPSDTLAKDGGAGATHHFSEPGEDDVKTKVTVFFKDNVATHLNVSHGALD